MSGVEDTQNTRQKIRGPRSDRNPIPTIQHYRQEKEQRREDALDSDDDQEDASPSTTQKTINVYKDWRQARHGANQADGQPQSVSDDEGLTNSQGSGADTDEQEDASEEDSSDGSEEGKGRGNNQYVVEDSSEVADHARQDPKQRRKSMKKRKGDRAERKVTDPVTHLPVKIHDFTNEDLKKTPHNEPAPGSNPPTATDTGGISKKEITEEQGAHAAMQSLFPPPNFDRVRQEITRVYRVALTAGLGVVLFVSVALMLMERVFGVSSRIESILFMTESSGKSLSSIVLLLLGAGLGSVIIWLLSGWTEKKIHHIWECNVWEAERHHDRHKDNSKEPETVQWLNSLFGNIWPIVNPDLFTSLADTLEDVMQASLPHLVRMISVEDIGQGSESLRILGIKWLPTGAAAKSVTEDGKLKVNKNKKNDRSVEGQGSIDKRSENDSEGDDEKRSSDQRKEKEQSAQNVAEGMEAEEGDFVNMEIAFAYRARVDRRGMRNRAKNAHLYLAFYLPGNIKLPVWVELHGLVGIVRLRLQLTPDPPFFSLCTLTFMGQPKVDLACVPLTKKGLNIMDLPVISNFVQSAVDAAMAEYVAPKSLTIDLKDMLIGDDFKKDTVARGVLIVYIKRAFDFKEGDMSVGFFKDGSADPYVTVGWAKFGKPVWSTRILQSEMKPCWEETAYILVTPQELNVDERLRVQLWDSDRTTADDDLGRIEVDLKSIMRDSRSNGKMWDRSDGFKALKAGEGMPGTLEWSVGYFSKTRILDSQLAEQCEDPDVKNMKQLKQKVYEKSEGKLREAKKDESVEIEQQKAQDLKTRQDELMIASPPPTEYCSGILSIQIHQITGLELEVINRNRQGRSDDAPDEQEEGEDLPSAYCNVIINHQKVYRTRTKPKNGKPFFNAGCERFIRNWQTTDLHISVRDARVHENDPLLGVVYLPLRKIFAKRSQASDFYPLAGGIGFGKVRISLLFRAVHLELPRPSLGWEYGTLEIQPSIQALDVPEELRGLRLKARTTLGRKKFYANSEGGWTSKNHQPARLAVRKRYNSALVMEFRKNSAIKDKTSAWCVLWLKDIPEDEDETIELPVYTGDLQRATACTLNESGEKVGLIEIKLKFWRGLSGYHTSLKKRDQNLADVMEVLDMANDIEEENDYDDTEISSGSDSNSSGDEPETCKSNGEEDLSKDGHRGPIAQARDYLDHAGQMHRKHRGLMQWKVPRTINWMKTKIDHGQKQAASLVKHNERENGIETEV